MPGGAIAVASDHAGFDLKEILKRDLQAAGHEVLDLGTNSTESVDYPDYGYYDENAGDYSDGQSSPAEVALSQETIVAVQQELSQLGYYHGPIDGLIGPQTTEAVREFQSFDKLSVTGQIDGPTLKALQNS